MSGFMIKGQYAHVLQHPLMIANRWAVPSKPIIASLPSVQNINLKALSFKDDNGVDKRAAFDRAELFSGAFLYACVDLCTSNPALAAVEEELTYNPYGGEVFKNVAGVAYIALVAVFLYRVLTRRAKRAREQKLAGSSSIPGQEEPSIFEQLRVRLNANVDPNRRTGPLDAFLGSAQAGLLAFGLYTFSTKLQTVIGVTDLPDGYTARNISITVRTIITGLSWLATFIFAANSVGLLGLTCQWLLFPDTMKEDKEDAARRAAAEAARGPQLPKISVSSKPGELRRAFQAAERLGKDNKTSSSTSSSSSSSSYSSGSASSSAGSFSSSAFASSITTSKAAAPPQPLKPSPFAALDVLEVESVAEQEKRTVSDNDSSA